MLSATCVELFLSVSVHVNKNVFFNRFFVFLFQFEQMSDHLYEAAYHGQKDAICGKISEISFRL